MGKKQTAFPKKKLHNITTQTFALKFGILFFEKYEAMRMDCRVS
jgi:hypothetical protein